MSEAATLRAIVALLLTLAGCDRGPPCVRTEPRLVHHDAWTQMVMVGKVMVPIFHPAHDSTENVCIERAAEGTRQ